MLRLGILVSGRGSNMQAILKNIQEGTLEAQIAVVISDNPQAGALEIAKQAGIEAVYIDPAPFKTKLEGAAEQKVIDCLKQHKVDLVCLAGFMRMVKPALLKAFPQKVINIHPSLLPAFPGLDAQKQAFEYGVKYSGCTVHYVDEGMDTGQIIDQAVVPVLPEDSADDLAARILEQEHQLYSQVIAQMTEA